MNPNKAICMCDIVNNAESWTTLGGNCATSSGTTLKNSEEAKEFMSKVQPDAYAKISHC